MNISCIISAGTCVIRPPTAPALFRSRRSRPAQWPQDLIHRYTSVREGRVGWAAPDGSQGEVGWLLRFFRAWKNHLRLHACTHVCLVTPVLCSQSQASWCNGEACLFDVPKCMMYKCSHCSVPASVLHVGSSLNSSGHMDECPIQLHTLLCKI